jgi:type IV pilus assembly protein PilN
MRVTVNLASRPFVELGPLLARLRMVTGALLVLLFGLWLGHKNLERKAKIADAAVQAWTVRTQALEQEWQQDQATMREPQNAAVQAKSVFLNNLFAQKSFSWTAALMDLENVLPGGLQVLSMQPQMTKDGHVLLRLQVTGARDKAVELVRNLETSKHFLNPRLAGESAAQASTGSRPGTMPQPTDLTDVNFDILAEYNAAGMDILPKADTNADQKDASPVSAQPMQPQGMAPNMQGQAQPQMQPGNAQPGSSAQRYGSQPSNQQRSMSGLSRPPGNWPQNQRQIYMQRLQSRGGQ